MARHRGAGGRFTSGGGKKAGKKGKKRASKGEKGALKAIRHSLARIEMKVGTPRALRRMALKDKKRLEAEIAGSEAALAAKYS